MLNTEIFEECAQINALIENSNKAEARSMVINLLDKLRRDGNEYTPLINHVIREVGLFPYIDPKTALWEDQVVVEAFKANVGDETPVTLHSAQSHVLKRLLLGDNIAVSAPTSFGKSFIVDAFIAIRQPENVVMIVPTIALADETRRRIEHKFSHKYKIITTTDATITERNIFIFPQERSFAYLDKLEKIDMLIVDEFKKNNLVNILQNNTAKTLVYAGSYNNINKVSTILADNLPYKETSLLRDFNDWLKVNYGDSFSLCQLSERGIGIHNGKMHRSLSQIQVKLFECTEGLDTIISTSSIIEGVNTQAEQVIVWSNKNGLHKFDYFTYRNIIGRAGRMFKYFVGKVYLLEEPPVQENTTLTIDFPDEVAESLDSEDPGIEINQEQNNHIKEYEEFMMNALGAENFRQIRKLSIFKSCDPRILKSLIEKLKANPNWPRGYAALAATNTYNWREPVLDVVSLLGDNMARLIKIAIWKMPDNWTRSIAEVYSELSDISYEDLFSAERYLSYNLCSTLSVINILKKSFDPTSPDISLFIGRAANAFLPKLVYQLEEYGLPRMISRKIQNSGLINLEDDSVEISEIIKQFNNIGREKVIQGLNNLLPFDKFIINYFYDGIC